MRNAIDVIWVTAAAGVLIGLLAAGVFKASNGSEIFLALGFWAMTISVARERSRAQSYKNGLKELSSQLTELREFLHADE